MRLVAFNAWSVGNKDIRNNLIGLADDADNPEVLALQEAKEYRGTIPGYHRVAADEGHREDANCVLLLRLKGLSHMQERIVRVDGPEWLGPKHNIRHPSRVFAGATVEYAKQRTDVLDVHRTWIGPMRRRNMDAYAAEDAAIVKWVGQRLERHPGRPIVLLGDWNNRRLDKRDLSVSDLAKRLGAQVRMKGIDGALLINATGKARELDRLYGSDGHHPVLITATPRTH